MPLLIEELLLTKLNQILPSTEALVTFSGNDCHIQARLVIKPMEQSM